VVKGYSQEEGIDYTKSYSLLTRFEAIWILLSFTIFNNMKLYQMIVKVYCEW